jgi:hypothetical protein
MYACMREMKGGSFESGFFELLYSFCKYHAGILFETSKRLELFP